MRPSQSLHTLLLDRGLFKDVSAAHAVGFLHRDFYAMGVIESIRNELGVDLSRGKNFWCRSRDCIRGDCSSL